jgi:hypothetical protein
MNSLRLTAMSPRASPTYDALIALCYLVI